MCGGVGPRPGNAGGPPGQSPTRCSAAPSGGSGETRAQATALVREGWGQGSPRVVFRDDLSPGKRRTSNERNGARARPPQAGAMGSVGRVPGRKVWKHDRARTPGAVVEPGGQGVDTYFFLTDLQVRNSDLAGSGTGSEGRWPTRGREWRLARMGDASDGHRRHPVGMGVGCSPVGWPRASSSGNQGSNVAGGLKAEPEPRDPAVRPGR